MKRTRSNRSQASKQLHIKIYTTPEILDAFAHFSSNQGRSASKQGEFLIKQALAAAGLLKVA